MCFSFLFLIWASFDNGVDNNNSNNNKNKKKIGYIVF